MGSSIRMRASERGSIGWHAANRQNRHRIQASEDDPLAVLRGIFARIFGVQRRPLHSGARPGVQQHSRELGSCEGSGCDGDCEGAVEQLPTRDRTVAPFDVCAVRYGTMAEKKSTLGVFFMSVRVVLGPSHLCRLLRQ